MNHLALAWKFAPWLAIALLAGALLWLRADLAATSAQRDQARQRAADLTEANRSLAGQLEQIEQARRDNDAIWTKVAAALDASQLRETHTSETITREIRNDPQTRAWADTPVPGGVREALRRPAPDDAPTP